MPVFSGTPVLINRMLGEVDQDDPTNLPVGCAAVCRNTEFSRDSTGTSLCANTRFGNCAIASGAKSPGTGLFDFQYQPQTAADSFFQSMVRFTLSGVLERESPSGSGRMQLVPAGMYSLPQNSHQISAQAGNKLWSAYSNLVTPTAGLSCFNPKTLNVDPMGMKSYGFRWTPATYVYAGEVVTPSQAKTGPQGNGHTYQAQNSGWTAAAANNEPNWPTADGGTVAEANVAPGQTPVTWKELTMVIANRLPTAPAPALAAGAGGLAPGLDVYVLITLLNGMGETGPSLSSKFTTSAGVTAVNVTIPTQASLGSWLAQLAAPYAPTGANVYVASVATGSAAPPISSYQQSNVAAVALGGNYLVTALPGSSIYPPTQNTARVTPGQLPTPETAATLTRNPGAGAFAAGRDVWVRISYSNANGETPLGPSNSVINTLANDAVNVEVDAVATLPQLATANVYEVDVPTGSPEPPITAYCLATTIGVPGTTAITAAAAGRPPVTVNGTGPGGNVPADTATGGINSTQGYRYAVPSWINRNQSYSGFTEAAVSKYIVDEDGWEIGVFNVATGAANVVGRLINWSVADGTQAGPFFWIGNVNLQVPSQNIVYPNSFQSDGYTITPTVLLDNVTTSAVFNFTDEYLEAASSATDRLRVQPAPAGVRVDYLKSADRMAVFGAQGYQSGLWVSLGADYENFYSDTGFLPIRACQGFNCWGSVYFRNQDWYMGERSCGVIEPGTGDPSSWSVYERWNGVGPCGPRAFDACAQFIIFVHQSGVYRYDGSGNPDLMTKEIPRRWGSINWAARQTICVAIDIDTHTVRIQAPVGQSKVPNMEFCLSYMEGWLNPLHFMTFSQKEVSQEAARRWSFNDVSAFVCKRIYRTVPNPPPNPLSPDGTAQLTSDFYVSQLAYTSTIADGLVNARTPGRYDDNGAGIDWKYQTVSASAMQKPSKPEGVVTSAIGIGPIAVTFIRGRHRLDGAPSPGSVLPCRPIDLTPLGPVDFTRKPERSIGDYWSVAYDNGKKPGVWGSIKKATVYVIPVKAARGSLDMGDR